LSNSVVGVKNKLRRLFQCGKPFFALLSAFHVRFEGPNRIIADHDRAS
jgi:hypothetical protein